MIDISALMVYMAVSMITPGPNNLTMMYLSANYGFRGTRRFFTASALSLLVKTLLCGALNVVLADLMPSVVGYMKWLGAGYMLYLAYTMGRSGFRAESGGEEKRSEATYGAGVLLQLLNMKSWVSCLSIFAVYVIPHTADWGIILLVSLAYFVVMVLSASAWGLFGSAIRGIYSKYRKPFGLVMGASLVYCAVTALL